MRSPSRVPIPSDRALALLSHLLRGLKMIGRSVLLLLFAVTLTARSADWFPVQAVQDGVLTAYRSLPTASRQWRVCALLPNVSDKFWWGIAWGIDEEASRLGAVVGMYEAGNDADGGQQRRQFKECMQRHAQAIVLAAVDAQGLNDLVADAMRRGVVVVDLLNGRTRHDATAEIVSNTFGLGAAAGAYVRRRCRDVRLKVAWIPGPAGAVWTEQARAGLRQSLDKCPVAWREAPHAALDTSSQMLLVRSLLADDPPDFVVANAPAALAAARYVGQSKRPVEVISYYPNEMVLQALRAGEITAVISNAPVLHARIAFDVAIKALEGQRHPRVVRLPVEAVDRDSIGKFATGKVVAPPGFRVRLRPLDQQARAD